MALQDIQKYIEVNKSQYPPDVLVVELRKAGHAEDEIRGALRSLNIVGFAGAPGQSVITTWGKTRGFALGFFVGGLISFVLFVATAYAAAFASMYVGGLLFNNIAIWLFFAASIVALISLAVPFWLFFRLRSRILYFARGILTGSILVVVFMFGIIFYGVVFWGWLW